MRKWSSTKPASPSVRWLRLLVASYQRTCYRPSHLPFGNNQRKNRLVVRCMFSCGIEPKWPGPRCREHKNRLHPRYGNFESTVCPWNNFNLSSPSLILNFFSLNKFTIKMRFYFCFADLSPEYPPLISIYWFSCSTEIPLCALSKLDSSTSENCKGSSVKNIAHFKQESLATGRATLRITFQIGDSLNHALT